MQYLLNIRFCIRWMLLIFWMTACSKEGKTPILPQEKHSFKLQIPNDNKIYHAAFPDFGGTEDLVSAERIVDFEELCQREITWAYFSNNWTVEKGGIKFPFQEVMTIHQTGKVPFIRMMPRSTFDAGEADDIYTMEKFLSGAFDEDIKQWAIEAKHTNIPLLVEFGTEVNGDWFPWNASYNGGSTKNHYGAPGLYDGMERFRDTYRRIIDICREQGANNITWFYHCDVYNNPDNNWNTKAGYYPGDDYIDWIGLSVYGAQTPDEDWMKFEDILTENWEEIMSISPQGKPLAILEWGVVDNVQHQKPEWISDAMSSIKPGGKFYPNIKAVSYWHENFDDTILKIDESPESLSAYRAAVDDEIFVSIPSFQ